MSSVATPQPEARSRRRKIYLWVAGVLVFVAVVAKLVAPAADAASFAVVCAVLWAIPAIYVAIRSVWRKVTYRVGVRLFLSYLLIGLTPFALFAFAAFLAGWVLIGQSASIRLGEKIDRQELRLAAAAHRAVGELGTRGIKDAERILGDAAPVQPDMPQHVTWLLSEAGQIWRSEETAALEMPRWAPQGVWRGPILIADKGYRAVIDRDGDRVAAALVPLDIANARAISEGEWFDVRVLVTGPRAPGKPGGISITTGARTGETRKGVWVNGRLAPEDQVEPGWIGSGRKEGSSWRNLKVLWARTSAHPLRWEDGSQAKGWSVLAMIRVHVAEAVQAFLGSFEGLGHDLKVMAGIAVWFFSTAYVVIISFAAIMILRVTRSTARLTKGARAVARGELGHRIPVKRRDQLGDLALSFNAMSDSVRSMLADVAEKERMAREMELAREIQSSLLPPAELASGPLAVFAYFRPATEVGGDYFDLFPLAPGRLIVSIGDVAGHGLPTGLLMAMVKSAVAALIEEGHRGGELLGRLNRVLLGQSLRQKMVSFALAEIDAANSRLEITSAGHPPGVLLAADGGVEEVLLASLPLGHRWPDPPASQVRPFPPGSRLLLYSDGLVEARNASGVAFGYDALRAALARHTALPARGLLAALLAELDRHLAGQPLADDLTVLVIEHVPAAS
ncbi:MAG: PP2C family protein-serine/threonine phosphatase [Thermoanaerobaculales bacterium]